MLHHDAGPTKRRIHAGLHALGRGATDLFAPDLRWHATHPLGEGEGAAAFGRAVWHPLRAAFPDLERRDDVLIGGTHHGADYLAATGHYFGIFAAPFLGIPPTGRWAALRFGEFHRLHAGRIAETWLLLDLIDLMRQAGCSPLPKGRGVEGLTPGPATADGVRFGPPDPAVSARSLALVEAMLGPLFEPDRASMGMERFWSPAMMWYGPCGIGATRGLDGFFRDHTDAWVAAIPDWQADLDTPHFANDAYVGFVGWPSIIATHTGPLLGLAPTGRPVRVTLMDFWRRDGDLLAENWVLIDLPDMLRQLGFDAFAHLPAHLRG